MDGPVSPARRLSRRRLLQGSLALAGLGLLTGCMTAPWRPGPARTPTLGVLLYSTPANDANLSAFLQGLGELGYVEGQNVLIEYRYAEGKPERLPQLAADLARLQPDVIFALGGDVAQAARDATATIPVVVATSADPVQGGLVASLARPGANVTGVTFVSSELAGKRLQFLREALPSVTRVAVLWDPGHADVDFAETQVAATTLGVELQPLQARSAGELDGALEALRSRWAAGLITVPSRLTLLHAKRVADFVVDQRFPMVSGWSVFARNGGLLSYGPRLSDAPRRAAHHVDKILKGANPAELPMERPTELELVLNLKTAQILGLTVPESILQQATEVIQ